MKSDKDLKTNLKLQDYELLAPANNKETAIKAIQAGADAVYIGYSKYGARVQAGNSIEDIIDIINYAHIYNVKIYITLNTILKNDELKNVQTLINKLYKIKADGIIIQDMGILELNLPPIPIIASTQCHNNTVEKILFLEKTGFKRVILPREITLEEIREIKNKTKIELEAFVHGALCVSYSGQCYLSSAIGGRSANRGECAQPCRRLYSLIDANGEIILKDKYILSLKDLNLSEQLENLILAGITSFKIEGRLKNESYVINNTAYYRKKLDAVLNNLNLKRSSEGISEYDFEPNPYKSFNRGFCEFYINKEKKELSTLNYSKSLGEYIGVVNTVKKNYFSLNTSILNNGDGICFFDENKSLQGTYINKTEGNIVYPLEIKGIREGCKIYRNYNKEFEDKLKNANIIRKIPVNFKVREINNGYIFILSDERGNSAVYITEGKYEIAIDKEKAVKTLAIQLAKSGNTEFLINNTDIKIKNIPFIKVSKINEIRRILTEKLRKIRLKNYNYIKRKNSYNVVNYPIKELDYRANILNDKAYEFYKKRGCKINERAFEGNISLRNKEVMISKYCIKSRLGICPKQNRIQKYKEPYILKDEFNKEYLVEFNCSDCVMKIRMKD